MGPRARANMGLGPLAALAAALLLLMTALAAPALGQAEAEASGHRGSAAGDPDRPVERTVTITNYNIAHGRGIDGEVDLERIAAVVADSDADIATLQEVDRHWSARSDFADQPARLGELLGMDHAYGANLDFAPLEPGDPNRQYGTATLSDHRILEHRNTLLPKADDAEEQRGLLEVLVDVDGLRLWVLNTHLEHTSAEARRLQVNAILDRVEQLDGPVVLTGDLNAEPHAPELAALFDVFDDAWDAAGSGDGPTFPAEDPQTRIDFVLVTPGIDVTRAEVPDTLASDHRPVVADVVVAPESAGLRRAAEARGARQ